MDIMLEIKDKEKSALLALGLARDDSRLVLVLVKHDFIIVPFLNVRESWIS